MLTENKEEAEHSRRDRRVKRRRVSLTTATVIEKVTISAVRFA
jgi:hypothetical protein